MFIDTQKRIIEYGIQVDDLSAAGKYDELHSLLKEMKAFSENDEEAKADAGLFYFLGTGFDVYADHLVRSGKTKTDSDVIIIQRISMAYYRKAITIYDQKKYADKLDLRIYTNYANLLLSVGRVIEALYYSIDEVFMDVTHYLHLYKKPAVQAGMAPAHYMAVTMIRDVLKTTGITATVGIGPNLYLAKVGMDIVAKKAPPDRDGVRVAELDEELYKRLLWPVRPLTAFWQMGEGKTHRLAKYGILTMGDIARTSIVDEEFLYRLFGIDAEIMIDHAWGIEPCTIADIKAYRPKAHSLSVGQVLPRPYAYDEARLVFAEMVEQLSMDLVNKGLATSCLTFWVSFDPVSLEKCRYDGPVAIDYYGRLHPKHTGGTVRLRTRTSSARVLRGALLVAFETHVDHQLYVRRLGVAANDTHNECLQLDMFTDYEALENDEKGVILSIRRKYGSNAILKGMNYLEGATARERNTQIGGHRA